MFKYDSLKHNNCNIFRFDKPHKFYWDSLKWKDSLIEVYCGNSLRPSSESTWYYDNNSIILDQQWTSVQESKREVTKYFLYEFSHDTFTFVLDKRLINEHKEFGD